jgi:hypothetical protein
MLVFALTIWSIASVALIIHLDLKVTKLKKRIDAYDNYFIKQGFNLACRSMDEAGQLPKEKRAPKYAAGDRDIDRL